MSEEKVLEMVMQKPKGMYKYNILLQTMYAVHFSNIKKEWIQTPTPFPDAAYYINQ